MINVVEMKDTLEEGKLNCAGVLGRPREIISHIRLLHVYPSFGFPSSFYLYTKETREGNHK